MMDQKYINFPFANTGDSTAIPDATDPLGGVSFNQGFTPPYSVAPTTTGSKSIPRKVFNYLMNVLSRTVQQYQQFGVPEWITPADNGGTAFRYAKNVTVRYSATVPGVSFTMYKSLVDANVSVPGTDANWQSLDSANNIIASLNANQPNLVFNGSGEFGITGWSGLGTFAPINDPNFGVGNYFTTTAALAAASLFPQSKKFPVGPGVVLCLAADVSTQGVTAGVVSILMAAFDSAGAFISNFTTTVVPNGTFIKRYTAVGTTPAGTASVSGEVAFAGVTAALNGALWRRMGVYAGNFAPPYGQEANVPSLISRTGDTMTGNLTLAQSASVVDVSYAMVFRSGAGGAYGPFLRSQATVQELQAINSAGTQLNLRLSDAGILNLPRARPTWLGFTPWDNNNLSPARIKAGGNQITFDWNTQHSNMVGVTVDASPEGGLWSTVNAPGVANQWQQLPTSGLPSIMQWGLATLPSTPTNNNVANFNFNFAFPNGTGAILVVPLDSNDGTDIPVLRGLPLSTSQFQVWGQGGQGSNFNNAVRFYWFAMGV